MSRTGSTPYPKKSSSFPSMQSADMNTNKVKIKSAPGMCFPMYINSSFKNELSLDLKYKRYSNVFHQITLWTVTLNYRIEGVYGDTRMHIVLKQSLFMK